MHSGPLDQLVSVEAETDTPDGYGGYAHTWGQVGQLWAAVTPMRAAETTREGALRSVVIYKVTVLAAAARALSLTTRHRLVWSGTPLNIREAPPLTSRTPTLDIIAEAGVAH